ncbi:MAG: arsenate reductase [Cyclobacteriaceae bacterium]|nr:arsenate reductase [Cyclobacteriaceae bacterium]MCH8516071.1 arsenate reductase [Cyclobacteriaceae bacterium]
MKKVFHLSTCKTCQRIMEEVCVDESFEQQNVKSQPISENQLEELKNKVGSFADLFNRQSIKYRQMGLKDKSLTESEIKQTILGHYSLLKRPIFVIDNKVFVGNAKKTVEAIKLHLGK